jgi:alkylated DNA repair dioxygenase AlkB
MTAQRRSDLAGQADLSPAEPALPAGFAYREGVISPGEEQMLVARFADLPFQPFEFHGYLGKRRVVSFGWHYDYAGGKLRPSGDVPPFLLSLRDAAADFAGVPADSLQQILITEYAAGAGIGWHRDRPMFKDIVAVSLLSPCTLRFRRKEGVGWERAAQRVDARSAYLLRGEARRAWYHSIPPVDRLRYSVTFRNFAPGCSPGRRS